MLTAFSIEHHQKPIHHHRFASSINDQSVHPKTSTHSGKLDLYRYVDLILGLLVVLGLWVFFMCHFEMLFSMCHWFFVMLYLAGDHVAQRAKSVVRDKVFR
jgi:hypothetical protein